MSDDTTRLLDTGGRPDITTRLSPPAKRRLDLVLAGVAGALAILVGITALGALRPHASDGAAPPSTIAPFASAAPATAVPAAPPNRAAHGAKGHD